MKQKPAYNMITFDGENLTQTPFDTYGEMYRASLVEEGVIKREKWDRFPNKIHLIMTTDGRFQIIVGESNHELLSLLKKQLPELNKMTQWEQKITVKKPVN